MPGGATKGEIDDFIAEYSLGFPNIVDEDGSLWLRFGATIRSSFLFVNDDGTIVARTGYGEMDEARLRDFVDQLSSQ